MLVDWLVIGTMVAIFCGLWVLLMFTLDMFHLANPRPHGGKRSGTARS